MQKEERDPPSFRMEFPTGNNESSDGEDDDFEFSFIRVPQTGSPITADEIFSDGKIRPIYPFFGRSLLINNDPDDSVTTAAAATGGDERSIRLPLRQLFIEEEPERASSSFSSTSSSSSSSSSSDELDGIPPGTYCVWTPKKERCKKSSSAGGSSSSLRWRLRDLVLGRSHSDGKEKFVFEEEKRGKSSKTEVDVVTAHRIINYGQNGQEVEKATGRKSLLPYKPDIMGFSANGNGLSRG